MRRLKASRRSYQADRFPGGPAHRSPCLYVIADGDEDVVVGVDLAAHGQVLQFDRQIECDETVACGHIAMHFGSDVNRHTAGAQVRIAPNEDSLSDRRNGFRCHGLLGEHRFSDGVDFNKT